MASDETTPPMDPPPEYLRQGRTDAPHAAPVADPGRMRRIGLVVVASAIVVTGAVGMWLAYEQGVRKGVQMAPPLIRADNTPIKIIPEKPGGMEVPHRDKSVYDRLDGKPETVEAERLLPPPEVIVKKPEPVAEPEVKAEAPIVKQVEDKPVPASAPTESAKPAEPAKPVKTAEEPPSPPAPKPEVEVAKPAAKPAQKPVVAKTKPKTLVVDNGYLIQVGAYRSTEAANAGWARLVKANKALLGALQPVVVRADLGSRGVFHRLRAGPVDGPEAANALCSRLKQRKVGCLVIKP